MDSVFGPAKRLQSGFGAFCGAVADVAGVPAGAIDDGDEQLAIGAASDGLRGRDEADREVDEGVPHETAGKRAAYRDSSAERRGGV